MTKVVIECIAGRVLQLHLASGLIRVPIDSNKFKVVTSTTEEHSVLQSRIEIEHDEEKQALKLFDGNDRLIIEITKDGNASQQSMTAAGHAALPTPTDQAFNTAMPDVAADGTKIKKEPGARGRGRGPGKKRQSQVQSQCQSEEYLISSYHRQTLIPTS